MFNHLILFRVLYCNNTCCEHTNFMLLLFLPLPLLLSSSVCLHACWSLHKEPEVLYPSPSTRGRQLKEEAHYENAELYENMPSPKLTTRYPPKPASSSSSISSGHYKTPVSKVSSKFLSADSKTKAAPQVTNTPPFKRHAFLCCVSFLVNESSLLPLLVFSH